MTEVTPNLPHCGNFCKYCFMGTLLLAAGGFVTDLNENQRLVLLHASEAVRAVDRTVLTGLEGNLASLAASCADSIEHLTLTAVAACAAVLAGVTAGLAALGLILEAARCVELLLTSSPNKFLTAVLADQSLVFKHSSISSLVSSCPRKDCNHTFGFGTIALISKLTRGLNR